MDPSSSQEPSATLADLPWASGYDPVSWAVKAIVYGNGAASVFDHAPDQSRIARMRHLDAQMNVRADWEYAYDAAGNIVREYDRTRPEGSSFAFDQYTFDELNRLVAAVIQSPTFGEQLQQFDYDAFGNRTSSSIMNVVNWQGAKGASAASVTASALLDSPNRQVVNMAFTAGDTRLLKNQLPAFTAAGLATGADYDAQGNLKRIYQKPTTGTPVTIYLEYDAFGRVIQSTNGATGIVEKYHYSAEGLRILVEEYAGTTLAKTRINLYNDARQLVSQYEKPAAGAVVWKRDIFHLGTREAAEVDAAGMHVTQVDHLGSPRVITGPSGALEGTQKYLPFGELLEQSGTFKTAKGFTNHEQTEASGLIYMQARFYLPWYGRFASPDPALDQHFTESQSWNIYAYVRNNPVMSTDPTGMLTTDQYIYDKEYFMRTGQHRVPSPAQSAQADSNQTGVQESDNGQKAAANPARNQQTGQSSAQTGNGQPSNGGSGKQALTLQEQDKNSTTEFVRVEFVFQMKKGVLNICVSDEEGKKWKIYSFLAVSGVGDAANNPAAVSQYKKGPIPPGNYLINANELVVFGERGVLSHHLNSERRDWGAFRVSLHEQFALPPGRTTGFFLHGDKNWSTAGCVSVGGGRYGNQAVWDSVYWIRRDTDGRIPFTVKE